MNTDQPQIKRQDLIDVKMACDAVERPPISVAYLQKLLGDLRDKLKAVHTTEFESVLKLIDDTMPAPKPEAVWKITLRTRDLLAGLQARIAPTVHKSPFTTGGKKDV